MNDNDVILLQLEELLAELEKIKLPILQVQLHKAHLNNTIDPEVIKKLLSHSTELLEQSEQVYVLFDSLETQLRNKIMARHLSHPEK